MDDSKTFREELGIQYPTLGRALWEPDPGGLYNAVQVGDVGFIRHGYFTYLFNALSPRDSSSDHPSEPDPHIPHYLQPLQPKISNHIRTSIDHRKDFRSKNVTTMSREPNIGALGPDDDTQITFSCSGRQGALLYLPFPAEREDTVALGDFGKWIVKNIHECMRFAEEQGLGVTRMEDIMIVTGRHLAKSWVKAVFSESRGGAQASFVVKVSRDSVVRLEERNLNGAQLRFGPSGEVLPENQCIFIRGYHVVRILNIWPKLRGLAGPARLPEPEPEPDTDLELMGVPNDVDYQDPLHTLLEYISEQAPPCDMVLVHEDDLKCTENSIPPLETLQPDALMRFLRDLAPMIHQFQCEAFSPGNENNLEAEVAVVTVATLSYSQNAFETPPNEGYVSHSQSTSNTTLSIYENFTGEQLEELDADNLAAFAEYFGGPPPTVGIAWPDHDEFRVESRPDTPYASVEDSQISPDPPPLVSTPPADFQLSLFSTTPEFESVPLFPTPPLPPEPPMSKRKARETSPQSESQVKKRAVAD